jgi:hypothetical protein
MYWAGKMSGMDAEPLLEQVPDRDLRLLSSVELAAGALGLPNHSGFSMEQRSNRAEENECGLLPGGS